MRFLKQMAVSVAGLMMAVSGGALAQIERTQLDSNAFALGTLTPRSGAMARDLWSGSERNAVADLLTGVPTAFSDPLHLELLRRVTLSPGEGPDGADNALAGRKFLTAAKAGFYRDAASLAELVPALRSEPSLSQVVAYADLMDGDVDTACARGAGLSDGRTNPFWVKLRLICYVRAGENSAADLTMGLLRRQNALTSTEDAQFTAFAAGRTPDIAVPSTVFEWAMLRERGVVATGDMLAGAPVGIVAAIARDANQPAALRDQALIRSMANRTIGADEARGLLDTLPTSSLTADYVAVTAQTRGSLEQYEAIASALDGAQGNLEAFMARAVLLAPQLGSAEPVTGYAPRADAIALAGMINGQSRLVEKWLLALANDATDPTSPARAGALLDLYGRLDPGAARRIGSYLGVALGAGDVPFFEAGPAAGQVPLATFVRAGLNAAEAGSEGPASLVYLMGLGVSTPDELDSIRNEVSLWARDRADLEWLDRQAIFRQEAAAFLGDLGAMSPSRIVDGRPVPRQKPAGN